MDNFYIFIVAIMATWRLSAMLSYESGPFNVFEWIRELIGIVHDDFGEKIIVPDRFLPELFDCVWCLSLWIGAFMGISLYFYPVLVWFLFPFALSTGAIMIEKANHG